VATVGSFEVREVTVVVIAGLQCIGKVVEGYLRILITRRAQRGCFTIQRCALVNASKGGVQSLMK
jgi:hypothetical protein